MMSSPYSISEFLKQIENMDYPEIKKYAEEVARRIEGLSFNVKGAVKARELGSMKYVQQIKQFLFFMGSGVKPGGVDEHIFQLYRPICEKLVQKKQFKPEVLDKFKWIEYNWFYITRDFLNLEGEQ